MAGVAIDAIMEDHTMSKRIACLSVIAAFLLCCSPDLYAAQIYVPADYPTIQVAIDAAVDGDMIVVSPGRYVENVDFLGKRITLQSTNPHDREVVASTIIDGNQAGSCVTIVDARDCVLRGLTLRNGSTRGWGGGVRCESPPVTIEDNVITGNYAELGGGGVAVVYSDGLAIIRGNTICGNSAHNFGGGVCIQSRGSIVKGNTITSNVGHMGAGIFVFEEAQVIGNVISSNVAPDTPGLAGLGGGIGSDAFRGFITDNVISSNTALAGAAFTCSGAFDLVMVGNIVSGSTAYEGYQGPAVYIPDGMDFTVAGNSVVDNQTPGICIEGVGPAIAVDNMVIGNGGSGIAARGSSKHDVAVLDNVVSCNRGGGIVLRYEGLLANNLVSDNSSDSNGGGVLLDGECLFTLLNNTIIGNRAAGSGGGIRVYRSKALIANNIIRDNNASNGPELDVGGEEVVWQHASLTVKNSNVAGGEAGVIVGGFATLTWGPTNIDADPLFVELGHWDDASTPDDPADDSFIPGDYHLLPGSPCIDAGTNDIDNPDTPEIETLPTTDIAGLPRIIDGDLDGTATVDIGAYEHLPGDVNYDGKVNVLDLLLVRNSLGSDPSSSIEARKADVNADGSVNVQDLLAVRGQLAR